MLTVKETVDNLSHSFEEFKSEHNNCAKGAEVKNASEKDWEIKLNRIEAHMDQTQERLNRIEVSAKRPMFGEDIQPAVVSEHKSAFMNYVTKGDDSSLMVLESKSLSAGSDPDGGYLVPEALHFDIERDLKQSSILRRLAKVMQISTDAVEFLVSEGDAEAGWVSESQVRGETATPVFSKIKIPVHELYAKPRATQKLLDDSKVDVENWLSQKIAARMTQLENQAFLYGDGDNKPKGILNYEIDFNSASKGKIQGFKSGKFGGFMNPKEASDILIDMVTSMKSTLLNDCVWLMSRSAHGLIRKLKDSNGNYLWQPGIENDARPRLLGYPVEISDDMPALNNEANSLSILFGNFKEGYQVVDRAGIRVLRDPFSVKPYVEFYTTCRVGGDVINHDAFKVLSFTA
ncbi:MAG: phage major capsid protein [Alphaproteobacteria bacterium]|nr:phage major capsid protein [Alphaproteobacteria bacterium]